MTESIERLAVARASATEIERVATEEGLTSLRVDGLRKALDGQTSLEELLRVSV